MTHRLTVVTERREYDREGSHIPVDLPEGPRGDGLSTAIVCGLRAGTDMRLFRFEFQPSPWFDIFGVCCRTQSRASEVQRDPRKSHGAALLMIANQNRRIADLEEALMGYDAGDRDAILDPQRGDKVEHRDGGTIYVNARYGRFVSVQRRPFGDSMAEPRTISVTTFLKWVADSSIVQEL